jgi:threonine/homoserine/homoserine lactone efflux protein
MEPLMLTLKYLGSAYLFYIGIMLLKSPRKKRSGQKAVPILRKESALHQFGIGFMSALLNPKNIIFYLSLFTAMVSAETPPFTRAFYGLWMVSIVFGWDVGVAFILGNAKAKAVFNRFLFGVEKFSGAMLTLFGILFCFQ